MSKTIWFDMTTSMQWTGGVVGIVRAELEVAKNIHAINKDVRFCMENNGNIIELSEDSLTWLWDADDVTQAYLKNRHKGANKSSSRVIDSLINQNNTQRNSGIGRSERLKNGFLMGVSVLPKYLQGLALLILYIPFKIIDVLSYVFMRLSLPKSIVKNNAIKEEELTRDSKIKADDILFSMGWMDSTKEKTFGDYRNKIKFKLVYLVYDLILINPQTSHLYNVSENKKFLEYFSWISNNCDFLLFGGETAKQDALRFQKGHYLRSPSGESIKFGSDIIKKKESSPAIDEEILQELGISGDFIITVGSIEARKNHDILYKAYAILSESASEGLPKLVFIGRPGSRSEELIDNIKRDPRVNNNILVISPSDEELDCLYRNCKFTLLPSFYEGWSLTLPESFGYGKLCLAADVPPLREIGDGLAEFINIYDPCAWAQRIKFYLDNPDQILRKENQIKENWQNTTWQDCSLQIDNLLKNCDFACSIDNSDYRTLWYDLTTSYARWRGGVSGIIRSELILAKEIYNSNINVKFFAYANGSIFIIPYDKLKMIFEAPSIEEGYRKFQKYWSSQESSGTGSRVPKELIKASENPFVFPELKSSYNYSDSRKNRLLHSLILITSVLPARLGDKILLSAYKLKNKFLGVSSDKTPAPTDEKKITFSKVTVPFNNGDYVLSVGLDWTTEVLEFLLQAKQKTHFEFTQLVYDLTPVITPHLHAESSTLMYHKFLRAVSAVSDRILFGGATAQRDAQLYFSKHNWSIAQSDYVKFGSDIVQTAEDVKDNENDDIILKKLAINKPFILTVGTIEIRKNHETLYKTYLNLLDKNIEPPLLIISGKPGWKISGFFESLQTDVRIKDYIKYLSPSDTELDVLYRKCLFTVLPSMYEGWSLTLPESLSYGKVCITSDVDPLREIGDGLVPFVHPWDINKWGEEIMRLYQNKEELKSLEAKIESEWHPITWQDCAKSVLSKIGLHYPE